MPPTTLACTACGAENPAGNKFCGGCGTRLPAACLACGHLNPSSQKFCGECGAALAGAAKPATSQVAPVSTPEQGVVPPVTVRSSAAIRDAAPATYTPKHLAEKILQSRAAFEGERKQVTVMFTDVSGFTAMSERLDPEEVHAIMDRAFEVILGAVHRYEGTINQFLGDGVMALFGAPIAHEDHPHRALRAALAIQDNLSILKREIRQKHGVKFRVRMGINTGLVVVGAIGRDLRMDYTAVGDTTNLAARLLGRAGPGEVVVSAPTHRLTEGFFVFEDLGEFSVKGKAEPVRAHLLVREIRGRTRLEVSKERGLTPLAGREAELDRLAQAYHRVADGQAAIVLVTGEPGVGKSRLLYEFLHRLEGNPLVELESSCLSHTQSIPYYPIVELARRYLGLSDGMADEGVRKLVASRLGALGLEGEEPAILLAHFLGVSAPPEFLTRLAGAQLKERTFNVLRTMFLRASQANPLILVVENLHWLDASSEEFLEYFVQGLAGSRVLIVLSTRPGPVPPWLAVPLTETIPLEGLDAQHLERMTRMLLGAEGVSSELLKLLLEKGEGNPLYVEEILRQLQETGGIAVEDREARLRAGDVRVPGTIHDIIAARIDRLAEPLKQTLQVAAVVGRQFAVPLLSRVLETNGALVGHLRDLHALEFIFPSAPEPEPVYSFKHALTQEVAYAGLLERRRRLYHAAVGESLEELYAGRTEEVVELLAYQFGRSAEDEKAVDYAIRAAEKAQRRWANAEALASFAAALKRLETMSDTEPNRLRRIDAVVKQAEIMFALGRHAEHIGALEAIRDLIEAAADPPRRAAWYYWTGFLHSLTGARPDVPIAYCREAVAIAEAHALDELKAFAESCLAHVYVMAGSFRDALDTGERALAMFEERGNVWWAARTLWNLSATGIFLGEWERSLEYCRRALEHGRVVNDTRMKVVGSWRTGWTHIQRGDTDAGLRWCEEALALSPSPFDGAMAKAARGYGLVKAGEVVTGTAELAEAVAWFERSHLPLTRSAFAIWLGDAHLRQGNLSEARAILEEVLATSRDVGYRHLEGIAHRLLGETLASHDPTAAARHLEAALQTLQEVGARNEVAKTLVVQAGLERAVGNIASARRLLEQALALFETLGTLDGPLRARATLAVVDARGRRLVIVSRSHRDLYQELARELPGKADVEVILDRREGERRRGGELLAPNRRRADRRSRAEVDAEIRSVGYGVVMEDIGA